MNALITVDGCADGLATFTYIQHTFIPSGALLHGYAKSPFLIGNNIELNWQFFINLHNMSLPEGTKASSSVKAFLAKKPLLELFLW
jgi:hypothetical protein